METDIEMTSTTQTETQDTIGSSELNAFEAEAITRSMDMSIEFWGQSQNPPEKIPATRLKCAKSTPGKASNVALKIWERMTQQDLDKVKNIDVALMREGEIGTMDLLHSLKSIIEGTGLAFEEMLKSVDDDPIESSISLTNEILHIFNQNEPPEIVEEDDYGSFIHYQPDTAATKRSERQREMSNKMKYLLNKAQRLGLRDIKVPSSPYLTERSKLSLVEKQVRAKMKVRNVQKAFGRSEQAMSDRFGPAVRYSKKKMSSHQRREIKRPSLADRPHFRTAVKAETLHYEDLIRHAPDLSKRMKRVHEIRKKFLEKARNNSEGKNTNSICKIQSAKNRHYGGPFSFNSYNRPIKGRTPKERKKYRISSMSSCSFGAYDTDESMSSTKINITIENNDAMTNEGDSVSSHTSKSQRKERPPSREEMLLEMKKMLKEAVQEVAMSGAVIQPIQVTGQKKKEMMYEPNQEGNEIKEKTPSMITDLKSKDETSLEAAYQKNNIGDTVVTVTQEAGIPPFRQIDSNKEENKVSTEVMVSKGFGGKGLKVSVISKLSGHETEQDFLSPRSKQQDVQEAINVLKEYLALNNNDAVIQEDINQSQNEEDQPTILSNITSPDEIVQEHSITSQTVTTTEVVIEPSISEKEEVEGEDDSKLKEFTFKKDGDVPTVQAYAVTMLMPIGTSEEMRQSYSPFQIGGVVLNPPYSRWMADHVGDTGDNGWSPWNSTLWETNELDNGYIITSRNDSDSLYVNTSEEQINQYSSTGDFAAVQSQMTMSSTSCTVTAASEEEETRRKNSIGKTAWGVYSVIMKSIIGALRIITKPFDFMKYFRATNKVENRPS